MSASLRKRLNLCPATYRRFVPLADIKGKGACWPNPPWRRRTIARGPQAGGLKNRARRRARSRCAIPGEREQGGRCAARAPRPPRNSSPGRTPRAPNRARLGRYCFVGETRPGPRSRARRVVSAPPDARTSFGGWLATALKRRAARLILFDLEIYRRLLTHGYSQSRIERSVLH